MAAGLAASLALTSGCATGSAGGGYGAPKSTRPEVAAALNHDTKYASVGIVVQGAVIGAAIGCGLGLLLGGGARSCAKGAAIGGVGGAVAGGVAANANQKQILEEDKQSKLFAELTQERDGLRAYNGKMEAAIARLRTDYKSLQQELAAKRITAAQYATAKSSIETDIGLLKKDAEKTQKTVAERNEDINKYTVSSQITYVSEVNLSYVHNINDELKQLDSDV